MKLFRYMTFFVVLMSPLYAMGQTDDINTKISLGSPVYSQYLQNGLMLNPAYAGSRDALSTMLSFRSQWMGMEGAPKMESFSIHSPLKNDRVGLGFKSYFMQYGATKETSLHGVYSDRIHLKTGKLAFGLSGGVDISNTNYAALENIEPDPVFSDDNKAYVLPNVSAGVYFYSNRFYVVMSVPRFLSYSNMGNGETDLSVSVNDCSLLFSTGALFELSEVFKLKPSLILEYSGTHKINQFVVSTNMIIADLFWVGASYRTTEQVLVGLLQANINPQLSVILSYDVPTGRMNTYSKGSTEIAIRYEFGSKASTADPRYF